MALDLLLAERSAHMRQERMDRRVEETAISMAYAVNRFIDKHKAGIRSAASMISSTLAFDEEALAESLIIYHDCCVFPDTKVTLLH